MSRKPTDDAPLLNYLDELIDKLREQIPAAIQQHESTAIHQSRVATRRISAALHVLKPILSKPRRHEFAGTLRKLRGRLGPLRDLDVMIGHLEAIHIARLQPAIAWVLQHLNDQRDKRRARTEKKMDPPKVLAKLGAWWGVRQEMTVARQAIDSLLAESLHLQLDSFIEHANGISDPTAVATKMRDPHELRIAGKSLRYSLEMAVENGHELPSGISRSFKQMQEALGEWHDFVVLAEGLMSLSLKELLPHHDAVLQVNVLSLAKLLLSRASRSLVRFASLWNKTGEEITRVVRQKFPLTEPVDIALFTGLKTDPDPPCSVKSPVDPVPPVAPPAETSAA